MKNTGETGGKDAAQGTTKAAEAVKTPKNKQAKKSK
ncbi:Hypothetical protein LUCI_0626 [Lucifera butyrica]|uniref:Uncharacterized protein n=1 Tax=Lucifera butyrica TaxID=1351585 RepID=A0A498R3J3_9FIRM|nr:Hypothetical protein LUCI_0626 [Lucifera butyrica]